MAAAFAQLAAGEAIDVAMGGTAPAEKIDPMMETVMAEKGVDMMFRIPASVDEALAAGPPDRIVAMGAGDIDAASGSVRVDWDLPDPEGQDIDGMRRIRDEIEKRVSDFINESTP
jgi:protein-tyrosine-phosphatase